MNKCALILLSSFIFSWSSLVFSQPQKMLYTLGSVTENNVKVTFFLEIKPKTKGQTELINQSGSVFHFVDLTGSDICDIFMYPDRNFEYFNISEPCRPERMWLIKYEGKDRKRTGKDLYLINNNFSHKLTFGFENNPKYLIITNKREEKRSYHSNIRDLDL